MAGIGAGAGTGAMTIGSWPVRMRCSAVRTTEWATPLTSGMKDSVTSAMRMPPGKGRARTAEHRPHDAQFKRGLHH
ncbi:hypothetical protein Are01nite_27380 [Actinoplanes regularis]|nr:hypothetical protein Are01nite_27380 [Actinoplanes regularis]